MSGRPPTLSELAGNRDKATKQAWDISSRLVEDVKPEKKPVLEGSKIQPSKLAGVKAEKMEPTSTASFQPMLEEQPTGCGGTTYKALGAFTDTKEEAQRNPALSARIDDDFSSCRTPLQVSNKNAFDVRCPFHASMGT